MAGGERVNQNEGALDVKPEHINQTPTNFGGSNYMEKGSSDGRDVPTKDAVIEATKRKDSTLLVKTDLVDQDVRNSAPGVREQE
ncbi:hypothetical protein DEM27_23740 [Metarhizobium album]|uniref:Uncharacterized protein n=1 Tax=Metarhizobium album TaxID=2182425 RepID=A0A2U2DKU0_9HYPH|nr:hypothetical protein [Rhizobium album]PWE53927.1 hypothetical protein DEM27_23740 [Rhizobium album]